MASNPPLHIKLAFNNELLCASDSVQEAHPSARYWLPYSNEKRLGVYMKMARIETINSEHHFAKLLASGIVKKIPQESTT